MKLGWLLLVLAACGEDAPTYGPCGPGLGFRVNLTFEGSSTPTWDPEADVLDMYYPASSAAPTASYEIDPAGAADGELTVVIPRPDGPADSVNFEFFAEAEAGFWSGNVIAPVTGVACQEVDLTVARAQP